MTCTEFREKYPTNEILALVVADYTYFYRFPSKLINFFMLKYIDSEKPLWRKIFFYVLKQKVELYNDDGKLTKLTEKATPTYLYANSEHQKAMACVLKEVLRVPNLATFEGQKIKVTKISE